MTADTHRPTADHHPLRELIAAIRGHALPAVDAASPGQQTPASLSSRADGSLDGGETVPLLSVLLVPDGVSTSECADVLVALDAQSVTDFELIIVPASEPPEDRQRLEESLAPFSSGLNTRSRVLPAPSQRPTSGHAAAIDAGITAACGRYISILDGRTIVFAHYVEVFERLATERPGAVLRTRAVAQAMRKMTWPDGRAGFEPVARATPASSPRFIALEHLVESQTPRGTYALPRHYFDDSHVTYLDALPGCEEDEVLLEAALTYGVHEAADEVTVLLRRYVDEVNEVVAESGVANNQQTGDGVINAPSEVPDHDLQVLLDATTTELASTKMTLAATQHQLDNAQHGLEEVSAELVSTRELHELAHHGLASTAVRCPAAGCVMTLHLTR